MGKWRVFCLHVASSLIKGEGGISVPFYSVQDCSIERNTLGLPGGGGGRRVDFAYEGVGMFVGNLELTSKGDQSGLLQEMFDP